MMSPWPALALPLLASTVLAQNDVDFWNVERPQDMANIKSLDVMCGKTHMEVQISFDRPYNGIIFSKGAVDQYNCIYVKPQTGATAYSFNIMYNQVTSTFSTAASDAARFGPFDQRWLPASLRDVALHCAQRNSSKPTFSCSLVKCTVFCLATFPVGHGHSGVMSNYSS